MGLARTQITVTGRRGSVAPAGGLGALIAIAVTVIAIVGVWLGAVVVATESMFVAVLAIAVTAVIVIGIAALVAKIRSVQPFVVRAHTTADSITFDAGPVISRILRWLAPAGIVLLASLVTLLLRGELYGDDPGDAVFSGVGRFGAVAFFATGIAIIVPGVRAWRDATGASLTLTRDAVSLVLPRTGGSASWPHIGGAQFTGHTATILASTGSLSWQARDLASDPVVLVDLIDYYAQTPAARQHIGTETLGLLESGRF